MCRLHYDVIYHPSRINSQYLKTWGVDRPALYRRGVHTTPDIFSCQHIVVNIVAPCKGIEDSLGFWIPRRGFPISGSWFQSLSVELGFWIPILSRIPDSLSCIPDSKDQDSGNHKQIFPDSGIWIPLHGANIACIAEQT